MFAFFKAANNSGSGTSASVTVPAVPVGYLVVVNIKFSGSVSALSVSDNASTPNTYALAAGPISNTTVAFQHYGVAVTPGATSITASWTTSRSWRMTVDIFSGGKLTNATVFDKVATNTGSGTSSSVTLAPTNANELIVAGISFNSGTSAAVKGTNYLLSANTTGIVTEYRQVGTTSETAPLSWTTSSLWDEIAGAYIARDQSSNFFELM